MQSSRAALVAGLVIAAGALGAAALQPPVRERSPDRSKPRYDAPGEAADYFVQQRAPDGLEVPVERYAPAVAAAQRMAKSGARGKLGASAWRHAGPPTVGGRTRALLFDPADPDTMYAGGVSGGVWKSIDGGATWHSTGDALANLATVSLAFDPDDTRTLYAGTGEGVYVARPVSRSRGVRGDGVFVTRDAGATWRQLASTRGRTDFDYVNRLAFDAAGRLYAATRTGVHVSLDAGAAWRRALAPPNAEGCAELLALPHRNRVLASCGVFSQSSIYASDDGGETWRATALPAGAGRTVLARAPSDPDVVYAVTAHHTDYNLLRIARSSDGGTTWTTTLDRDGDALSRLVLSNPFASVDDQCRTGVVPPLGQGWFDNAVAVDPRDPDVVWVGGVDLFRSDDGARTFRIASRWWSNEGVLGRVHGDQHAIVFDPRYDGTTNRRLWVANDGGIWRTDDARGPVSTAICDESGTMAWSARNQGYRVTQFYHGAASADGARLIAGAQDNGTQLGEGDAPWREVYGGDGAYSAIDPRDPRRFYASSQFAGFVRSDDDGASFVQLRSGLPPQIANYAFIHPFVLDPNNPDTLYTSAGARLYRSSNRGGLWTPTSLGDIVTVAGGTRISAIALARGTPGRIAVGFESGALARSLDAGATWSVANVRDGFVSSLAYDDADPQVLYATYSTFGGTHVHVSRDGGVTWSGLDGEGADARLPDVPAHVLRIDPRDRQRLWLGTDIGLFTSPDGGRRWFADASGLGNVLIEELVVVGSGAGAELVAFTYGRGAFRAPLAALTTVPANPGYGGAWFEPATAGQGMQVEVIPAAGLVAVGWYTYGASPGEGANHDWLVGSGAFGDHTATIALHRVRSGRFAAADAAALEPAGTLALTFESCSRARASYVLGSGAGERRGEIELSRLTSAAPCVAFRALGDGALSALATDASPGDFEYGHSGSWLDPGAQQQGFVLEVEPSTRGIVASWYTFDPAQSRDGREAATWYTAQGTLAGDASTLTVFRTTGGVFDAADPVASAAVGTLALRARGCSAIDASYSLTLADGSARSGTFDLVRVAPATVCEAMAP